MRSLRGRLTLYLLAGSGVLLMLGGFLAYRVIASRLERDFDHELVAKANSLALLTEEANGALWVELPEEGMPEFSATTGSEYFQFWFADGRVLRRSGSLAGRNLRRLRATGPALGFLAGEPRIWDAVLPDGRLGRVVQLSVMPRIDDHPEGALPTAGEEVKFNPGGLRAILVLARGRGELDRFLAEAKAWLGASFLFLLLGLAALIRWSLHAGLAPLSRLSDRIERLDATSLGERIDPAGVPLEITGVVQRVNDMLGRLETSFVREKAFSSHLAHELRTPLAELRAATEIGLRWPDDRASVAASLEDARAIGLHMEGIAENLLALARNESAHGEDPLLEPVSLRAAVDEAWRPFARAAADKQIELHNEIPEQLDFPTDRAKFELILKNLLGNAVSHGSFGGWVSCRACFAAATNGDGTNHAAAPVGPGGQAPIGLSVTNPTADLAPEDLPHLFDRFWQKDPSRFGPHVGLGLSLVASLGRSLGLGVAARLDGGQLEIRLARA